MGQARFPLGVTKVCWRSFKPLNQALLEKLEPQRMDMPWRSVQPSGGAVSSIYWSR